MITKTYNIWMVCLCFCLNVHAHRSFAAQKTVPGTGVSLKIPGEAFVEGKEFAGFVAAEQKSTVMVMELAAPFVKTSASFHKERLAVKGMKELHRQAFVFGSIPGVLVEVRQEVQGKAYTKFLSLLGDESHTVIVASSFPQESSPKWRDKMYGIASSVQWKSIDSSPFAGESFQLAPPAGLVRAGKYGSMIMFMRSEDVLKQNPTLPAFMVGPWFGKHFSVALARKNLNEITSFKVQKIEKEIQKAGKDGTQHIALTASGTSRDGKHPIRIFYSLVQKGTSFWVLIGTVGAKSSDQYLPLFSRSASTLVPKS